MRSLLPSLLALVTAVHAAPAKKSTLGDSPALSLLPDGSQLEGVVIPHHDKEHRLVNSLSAELVTMVNRDTIDATKVVIDFYDKKGERSAQIRFIEATLKQKANLIQSKLPVTIHSRSFEARGSGLHYSLEGGQGLLLGPAATWIKSNPDTAMNLKSTPSLFGAAGLAILSQSGASAQQPASTTTTKDPVLVVGRAPEGASIDDPNKAAREAEQSRKASESALGFIAQTSADPKKILPGDASQAVEQPLQVTPGPMDTVITCDGGMVFDAEKGILIYYKNVKVSDPRYTLSGADEFKVFLGTKKPTGKPQAKPEGGDMDLGAKFDKVERIEAKGAVRILQKATEKGKAPVEASGASFTYYPETGQMILSGGYPWVLQGSTYMRAKQPNLTLRVEKSGSFKTEGEWEMGGTLNQNKKTENKPNR